MSRICTVCARSGSKGFPGKNESLVQGLPLYAISLLQAQKSKLFDAIVFSTDSQKWLESAMQYGATMGVLRPPELANDTSGKVPAIIHALKSTEERNQTTYDVCIDLDVTAPLRLLKDIENAIKLLEQSDATNVVSGCVSHRSPYFNLVELGADGYVTVSKPLGKVLRRQDAPKCYDLNGSVYVWRREALINSETVYLEKTRIYEMPEERARDIDTKLDYDIVSFIAQRDRRFLSEW